MTKADEPLNRATYLGMCALGLAVLVIADDFTSLAAAPPDVLGNRGLLTAGVATLLMSAIFFAALLYLPQFMTKKLGYSAVEAGAGLLPMMGTFALTSFVSGPLYARLGPKLIVSAGAACLAGGMFMLSGIHATAIYADLVPGMIVLGLGVGLFYSSITTVAITALDPSRASLGGAIIYMAQIAGGAVGLGLNTAVVVTAPNLAGGIHGAFLVDAVLAVCGLAVSALFVGGIVDRERLRSLMHHHRGHG